MAGSKLTVKASTILEVVVSMVIIVVVFGIAMMIYSNVVRSSPSAKKLKAELILQETMIKLQQQPDSTAQSTIVDDFKIEQKIEPYNGNPALLKIGLTAFDQNQQKVAELQKVIIAHE
ncbi:MAG: hypothetical protein V4577_29975 [Bacteroidota bacterium]